MYKLKAIKRLVELLLGKKGVDYINEKNVGSRKSDYFLLFVAVVLIGVGIYYFVARQSF